MSGQGNYDETQIQVGNQTYMGQDFYIYSANLGNIAAAATVTAQLQIQSDSDFEWIMSTCYGNLNGGSTPFSDAILLPLTVTLVDAGSARQLFSGGVPINSFSGTGKQPFILPVTRIFKAFSSITISATSFAAAQYDNIFLNFIGRKLFLGSR